MTCVDPLQLGIMGRKMTESVASDWRKAVTWSHYICSDWLNLESFLIVTSALLARHGKGSDSSDFFHTIHAHCVAKEAECSDLLNTLLLMESSGQEEAGHGQTFLGEQDHVIRQTHRPAEK
jgi:hypothetical protein